MEVDYSVPRMMLEEFEDTQTTVWFVEHPRTNFEASWYGHTVYPSLSAAVHAVNDNRDMFFGFDVFIHKEEGDKQVTQQELALLVGLIRQTNEGQVERG